MEKYNNKVPTVSFQDCIIDSKLQTQKLNFPNFGVHATYEASIFYRFSLCYGLVCKSILLIIFFLSW